MSNQEKSDTNGTLGQRLVLARGKATQQSVADAVGVSRSVVAKYERDGSIPDAVAALKMAKHLEVNFEWLIEGVGPQHPGPEEQALRGQIQTLEQKLQAALQHIDMTQEVSTTDEDKRTEIKLASYIARALEEAALMGSLSFHPLAWTVLAQLLRAVPESLTVEELARAISREDREVAAVCKALQHQGMVVDDEKAPERYTLANPSALLRAIDPAGAGALLHRAVEDLVLEVLPSAEAGRGIVFDGRLRVPQEKAAEVTKALWSKIRELAEQATHDHGEGEILLVLGLSHKETTL